jgi:Calcineurin-like phosphoesterase
MTGTRAVVRVVTTDAQCPALDLDGVSLPMTIRAAPATVPVRAGGGAQTDSKPAVFDVLTCEAELPSGAVAGSARASVQGRQVALPRAEIKTIVVLGDTGCRIKKSDNFFQDCKDPQSWPLEWVAGRAALLNPDLVIHVGDYHYRESPCPADMPGCAGSPWGFGFDAWQVDFFDPVRKLLAAAPWVFVRGNHESCFRAGQGWFRFLDNEPWSEQRSCNDPKLDNDADYSTPFAVPLAMHGADTQLIVFDSSRTSNNAYGAQDPAYRKYSAELQAVDKLAQQAPHNFFLSHHPVLAYFSYPSEGTIAAGPGNAGLQSVMRDLHPGRLFGPGIDAGMHGHVHLFEMLSFDSGQPLALVMGNAGSSRDLPLPKALPPGTTPAPGASVHEFVTTHEFGFASIERQGADWLLTEWNLQGEPMLYCSLRGATGHCTDGSAKH